MNIVEFVDMCDKIDLIVETITDTIVSLSGSGWHIVASTVQPMMKGVSLFIDNENVDEFVDSSNCRYTKLGELIYEFYSSSHGDRELKWFKNDMKQLIS